jgi:hypothetical protein
MSLTPSSPASSGVLPAVTWPVRPDASSRTGDPATSPSDAARTTVDRFAPAPTPRADDSSPAVLPSSAPAPRALAPAGTDPELWRALSTDEHAFFARVPASGTPVYDRHSGLAAASAPVRRGLHLDLRA